jgi:PAS domain S-box-containing protein
MRVYRGTQIKLVIDAEKLNRNLVERSSQLIEARARYKSLVEHIPQMITRKDLNGLITYANSAFCTLNKLSVEEIIRKTDMDLYGQEMAAKYKNDDETVKLTKKILPITEKHRPLGSSKEMDVEGTKIPVLDANGNVIEIQTVFWDITERKRRELQLQA